MGNITRRAEIRARSTADVRGTFKDPVGFAETWLVSIRSIHLFIERERTTNVESSFEIVERFDTLVPVSCMRTIRSWILFPLANVV